MEKIFIGNKLEVFLQIMQSFLLVVVDLIFTNDKASLSLYLIFLIIKIRFFIKQREFHVLYKSNE